MSGPVSRGWRIPAPDYQHANIIAILIIIAGAWGFP
ncbi:hypothetical protein HCH_06712 [Hahella chejuensis KCTC 2396]|uniref:Uncharacterized protein n=1 Tax=Hahella chejuensis (strain KCTC 2396) TaxID=349521 RepID=Q2S7N5_HAHCH|nr:hypothetical protein HCH_06712 [Hahella chejuensis KCTC 2396]